MNCAGRGEEPARQGFDPGVSLRSNDGWSYERPRAPSPLAGEGVVAKQRRMRGVARSATALYGLEAVTQEIPRNTLRRFAREQRAQAVQAETFIWRAVRNRRCDGMKFQRQVPVGNYILDFVCFERRLVVEIDGPSHQFPEQRRADKDRDAWLQEQGFRVLRFAERAGDSVNGTGRCADTRRTDRLRVGSSRWTASTFELSVRRRCSADLGHERRNAGLSSRHVSRPGRSRGFG